MKTETTPWRDAGGEIGGLIIVADTVNEFVAAVDRSERAEQRFNLALELADLHVWEVDYQAQELFKTGAEATLAGATIWATAASLGGAVWNATIRDTLTASGGPNDRSLPETPTTAPLIGLAAVLRATVALSMLMAMNCEPCRVIGARP